MSHGKEVITVLLFATAFLFLLYNPISLSFEISTLIGLALLLVFGALVSVGGLLRIPLYYVLPIAVLAVIDYRMIGVFLFALLGMGAASEREKNLVKPNMKMITKAAFAGFTIFLIVSVIPIYKSVEFGIPPVIMDFVTARITPLIFGCEAGYTGQECIDIHVNEIIDNQCEGDSECITMLNDQRAAMERLEEEQLLEFMPAFSRNETIGGAIGDAVNQQIRNFLGPYENLFKIVVAAAVFSVFHVLAGPFVVGSTVIAAALLKLMILLRVVEKKTVKVDKTIFSI